MEYEKLWGLLNDLSKQLSINRQQCETLHRQAEELKSQAVHNGTGFTLRRFNTDITQEQFETELERLNATLVLENHALQHENKQLSMLLKDYEATLETVMSRFRTFAHSTQQHDLNMTRHYEHLISSQQPQSYSIASTSHEIPLFGDPLAVQSSLFRLAALLRKALRSIQGEDSPTFGTKELDSSDSGDEEEDAFFGGYHSSFGIPPPNEPNARLGGFLRLLGSNSGSGKQETTKVSGDDTSLERDIEVEKLRQENDLLRQLLSIQNEPLS